MIKKCSITIFILFFTWLTIFLSLVYVNDERISIPNLEKKQPTQQYQKIKSFFRDEIFYEFTSFYDVLKTKQNIKNLFPNHTIFTHSNRFKLQEQIYISLGTYPKKLEGKDALVIPKDNSLFLLPKLDQKIILNFSGSGLDQNSQITLLLDNQKIFEKEFSAISQPNNTKTLFYKYIGRYINLNQPPSGGEWLELNLNLEVHPTSKIEIRCESNGLGCLISEPLIFSPQTTPKTNYVLIVIDALNLNLVTEKIMPFLSQLKNDGLFFSNAYSSSNMTSPSVNGLLTGIFPSELKNVGFSYSVPHEARENFYRDRQPSFPDLLRKNGYKNLMAGNITVLSEVLGMGLHHGFDDQLSMEVEGYETPLLVKNILPWFGENQDKLFFSYLHFHAPHQPTRPPIRDFLHFLTWKNLLSGLPPIIRDLYSGEAFFTDRYLKKLFSELEKMSFFDHTIFIITADHGEQTETRRWKNNVAGPTYDATVFDHGGTLLNEEIHIPLIMWSKNKNLIPASQIDTKLITHLDIGPLILKSFHPEKDRTLKFESFKERAIIFSNQYKYIRSYDLFDKIIYQENSYILNRGRYFQPEQIYDLKNDPKEKENLIDHENLLLEARTKFHNSFNIKERYELIVFNPELKDFTILHDGKFLRDNLENKESPISIASKVKLYKAILENLKTTPQIEINHQAIPFLFSSLGLKYNLKKLSFPSLFTELFPIDLSYHFQLKPIALLRKIWDHEFTSKYVSTGNPMFEQILKDWGYINEN